jgi:hypothetical protein
MESVAIASEYSLITLWLISSTRLKETDGVVGSKAVCANISASYKVAPGRARALMFAI